MFDLILTSAVTKADDNLNETYHSWHELLVKEVKCVQREGKVCLILHVIHSFEVMLRSSFDLVCTEFKTSSGRQNQPLLKGKKTSPRLKGKAALQSLLSLGFSARPTLPAVRGPTSSAVHRDDDKQEAHNEQNLRRSQSMTSTWPATTRGQRHIVLVVVGKAPAQRERRLSETVPT